MRGIKRGENWLLMMILNDCHLFTRWLLDISALITEEKRRRGGEFVFLLFGRHSLFIGQLIVIECLQDIRTYMAIWFMLYFAHCTHWLISFYLGLCLVLPGSFLLCSEGIHFPVASYTFHAIYFAKVLPPCFEPAQTQNSALLNSTSSFPVFGNRERTGGGFISNFFVLQFSQVFMFAAFHSLGSMNW